ncbi:hypothetical protein SAMN05216412_10220 [Nitrosospira multiformis]|uniref:Uncharacterized protein n=1 Tax=Nitrosospira multiformis TaxID=1231 RepID=A0A1H9ZY67_9PROT|nr:hypothetical protein SAMN05216412_10220 [Nitrosospira multiformis]
MLHFSASARCEGQGRNVVALNVAWNSGSGAALKEHQRIQLSDSFVYLTLPESMPEDWVVV